MSQPLLSWNLLKICHLVIRLDEWKLLEVLRPTNIEATGIKDLIETLGISENLFHVTQIRKFIPSASDKFYKKDLFHVTQICKSIIQLD